MRDINRIDNILKELGDMWKMYPDLRLGQLILNVVPADPTLYYLEDDLLITVLKYHYLKEKNDD